MHNLKHLQNLENNAKDNYEEPVEQRDGEVEADQGHGPEHAGVHHLHTQCVRNLVRLNKSDLGD